MAHLIPTGGDGAARVVYAWYILSGSMSRFFVEDASLTSRTQILPFALVGWAAMALLMAFAALYTADLLGSSKAIKHDINDSTKDYGF